MRERDDDEPVEAGHGSLADGVGETDDTGGYQSTADPYGDTDLGDDSYGDDPYGDSSGDGPSTEDTYDDSYGDDSYGDAAGAEPSADGTYGDGDTDAADPPDDDTDPVDVEVDETVTEDESPFDDAELAQDTSPLEGIGFLIDEVREALFGEDDAGAASPFDTDPVDLETETDLDLTGDGVVDRADLHEAASSFDFGVSDGHHHHVHHDDGVMDA